MRIDYSLTNISHCLQTALNLLNIGKKHITNWDKHVYGRLISKIQNSFIVVFTDGGKFNNQYKVFRKNSKINFALQDEDEIYNDPFSWDQNLISIIMNPQPDEESLCLVNKYTNVIGGKVLTCENFEDYMNKIEKLAFSDFLFNRVNMYLEINNNVINIIQQNEIKSRDKEISGQFGQLLIGTSMNNINSINNILPNFSLNQNFPKIKFKNKSTFNKGLVPLTFDLKQFKQISLNVAGNDQIFDRNENISFKEKWPLPDDFLMNKTIKTLQKKKSHPSYVIANELQYDFEVKRMDYDEYEIEDKEFITRFLENYPDLTAKVLKELVKNNHKIIWDVYSFINNAENILKKPFAVIKLNLSNKVATMFNSNNLLHDELPIFEYIKQSDNDSHIKLKLCVLPYNYREYFQIIQNIQSNSINKTEFIIQMEKYMMRIPFYYKPYVIANLEKKNLWKCEENFGKTLDEENLNENVIANIKNIVERENEKITEMNKIYLKNKQLHINNSSSCCGVNIFKLNKREEDAVKNYSSSDKNLSTSYNDKSYVDFLNNCSDFQSFINQKKLESFNISTKKDFTMKLNKTTTKDEMEISKMGDFYENVIKMTPLRNPYLFDFEVREFKGDYFGNPFRKMRVDTELYGNLNLENPNINIKDGEVLLINCDKDGDAKQSTSSYSQSQSKKEILDEELSIRPGQVLPCDKSRIKTNISSLTTVNQIVDTENKLQNKKRKRNLPSDDSDNISDIDIVSKSTKSSKSDSSLPNKLQMQLIDDDLTGEFKQLFARNISDKNDRNDIIVNNCFNIDMNVIYDWKLKEKLKEYSKVIIENAKSSNKNILKIIDDILSKPFLFYTERQKISFINKVKNICETFGTSKSLIQQIKDKLNNIHIENI